MDCSALKMFSFGHKNVVLQQRRDCFREPFVGVWILNGLSVSARFSNRNQKGPLAN